MGDGPIARLAEQHVKKDPREVLSARAPGIEVDTFGGMCPVQVEGKVDGLPFYFRARGEAWSMRIAAAPDGDVFAEDAWFYGEPWGIWPEAGYMPDGVAIQHIEASVERWRKSKLPPDPADLAADKLAALRALATGWEKEATNESALSIIEDELDKSREHWARGDTLGKCAAAIFAIVGRE